MHKATRIAYKILLGKSEMKRLPGRPQNIFENHIKKYLKQILCEAVD